MILSSDWRMRRIVGGRGRDKSRVTHREDLEFDKKTRKTLIGGHKENHMLRISIGRFRRAVSGLLCCGGVHKDENEFKGSEITILKNGNMVSTIPAGFRNFQECFDSQRDDVFEFKHHQDNDGVSCKKRISSIKKIECLDLYNKFFRKR